MEDSEILLLYWNRQERAIYETDLKYGPYCRSIARSIVQNSADAEECVNDTYLDAWNAIPPNRPAILSTFLGKITRRIAIDRCRILCAQKRGGGETALALDELDECIRGSCDVEQELQKKELTAAIRLFAQRLSTGERNVFLLRYWYVMPVASIAQQLGFTPSKVTAMLHRIREKLRKHLKKEGFL